MTKEKIDYIMNLIKKYGRDQWKAAKDDDWEAFDRRDAEKKEGEEILKEIKGVLLSED